MGIIYTKPSGSFEDPANKSAPNGYAEFIDSNLIIQSGQNQGIKINPSSPQFSWEDLFGILVVNASGANAPALEEYDTGLDDLAYNISDKARWKYHVTHRDVIGGDKFLHPHIAISIGTTNVTGSLELTHRIRLIHGHARGTVQAAITIVQTITGADLLATPSGSDFIPDILFMQSGGGANLLDSDLWLPDDRVMVETTVTGVPNITSTMGTNIFLPFFDIHREVKDGSGTLNKDPSGGSFYG